MTPFLSETISHTVLLGSACAIFEKGCRAIRN
jgi:ABC-type Mn2+/Zn2+ transport system permease subunit